jgi:hypothetical protein
LFHLALFSQYYDDRPNITTVRKHPFFWSSSKKLTFICDVDLALRTLDGSFIELKDCIAVNSWDQKMDKDILAHMGSTNYNFHSTKSLIRYIMNLSVTFIAFVNSSLIASNYQKHQESLPGIAREVKRRPFECACRNLGPFQLQIPHVVCIQIL